MFEVVARPNGWQKSVNAAARQAAGVTGPTLNQRRQEFFQEVLTALAEQRPRIRVPKPNRDSWVSYASGPFGHWDISFAGDGRLRAEVYVDCSDAGRNKALFDGCIRNVILATSQASRSCNNLQDSPPRATVRRTR